MRCISTLLYALHVNLLMHGHTSLKLIIRKPNSYSVKNKEEYSYIDQNANKNLNAWRYMSHRVYPKITETAFIQVLSLKKYSLEVLS